SFSTKQRRTPAVAAARMDWVMSPSSGDALLCFVKRTVPAGSKSTNWYRQDYTQHKVVVDYIDAVTATDTSTAPDVIWPELPEE
ncbi:tail fiber assembly protein, partial [Escherichia coli]|uniref:tail fiber assembly protein n=1 Tax=Escherichia coli TaxID=562 RepID=UPI001F5B46C6